MKFVLATPRILLCEEVDADGPEEAIAQVRDSGAFARGMTALMGAGDFDTTIGSEGDIPTVTYVINTETKDTSTFEMRLHWQIVEPEIVHRP